uniref:Uncharacterized protein n=1 Tax=Arundo donax TaxID=35708 RepID=A0A0A8YQT6_ARUDO
MGPKLFISTEQVKATPSYLNT